MILCHCMRVNDRQIRAAVESGANTVGKVARLIGAGSCCGGCAPAVAEVIARHRPLPTFTVTGFAGDEFVAAE
jgi:bacterioferritin-associated ferredoxin